MNSRSIKSGLKAQKSSTNFRNNFPFHERLYHRHDHIEERDTVDDVHGLEFRRESILKIAEKHPQRFDFRSHQVLYARVIHVKDDYEAF